MDDQLIKDLIRALKDVSSRGRRPFGPEGNDAQGYRDGWGERSEASVKDKIRSFNEQVEKSNKTLKDIRETQAKFGKTMLEGIPVFGKFIKKTNETTRIIEESVQGQSKAYKQSSEAAQEFADSMGINSKKFNKVTEKFGEIYESTDKISKLSKQKEEAEQEALKLVQKAGIKNLKEFSNVSDLIGALQDKLQKAKDQKKSTEPYKEALDALKKLEDIPEHIKEEIKKAKETLEDKSFQKEMENNPKTRKMFSEMRATLEGDDIDEIIERLGGLDKVKDYLAGLYNTANIIQGQDQKFSKELKDQFKDLGKNLGKAVALGLGEALMKEAQMPFTRQRLTGRPQAYSARLQAVNMGMSETDLLTSMSENRYLFRRISRESGLGEGAGDMLRSGNLNELRKLSYEMGFIGKEALDNLVKVSENLRVIGVDLSKANIAGNMEFIRDTFKDIGLTQEQMAQFVGEMSREGRMATRISGQDSRFANLEAIQEEIEFRGKLARVLNQELDLQKKRVRHLAESAYGDPVQAIERAISAKMLAGKVGMSNRQRDLIFELEKTGGAGMSDEARREAEIATQVMRLRTGRSLVEAAKGDNMGDRAVITRMAQGFGQFTGTEAVEAYERKRGAGEEITVEAVREASMANTEEAAGAVGGLATKLGEGLDLVKGTLSSAIGNSAGAIVSAIGKNTVSIVSAILGARRIRAIAGGAGRAISRGARGARRGARRGLGAARRFGGSTVGKSLGIGIGASMANSALQNATEGTEHEQVAGIGSAALTGATYGAFLGPKGALVGAGVGTALGGLRYLLRDRDKEARHSLSRDLGNFYGVTEGPQEFDRDKVMESMDLKKKIVQEEMKQRMSSEFDIDSFKRKKLMEGRVRELDSEQTAGMFSIAGNLSRLDSLDKSIKTAKRGRGPMFSGGTVTEEDRRTIALSEKLKKDTISELSGDITAMVSSGDYKKVSSDRAIQSMIDVLKKDEVKDSEQEKIFSDLREWMEMSEKQRKEHIEATKEGNEKQVRASKDISELMETNNLDQKLAGAVTSTYNRIFA